MNTSIIAQALIGLLALGVMLVMAYRCDMESVRAELISMAARLIAEAEQLDLTGPEKMERVVKILRAEVPHSFANILTQDRIQSMAQSVFDSMSWYASNRIHKR